jgi:hypothetical protein
VHCQWPVLLPFGVDAPACPRLLPLCVDCIGLGVDVLHVELSVPGPHPDVGGAADELEVDVLHVELSVPGPHPASAVGGGGGESHANWKDDDVGYKALHDWLRNHWPEGIPKYCSVCGLEKDLELCNISPTPNPKTYNRDIKNWFFACNLCHRRTDGRLERAVVYNVGRKLPLETIEKMRETHIGKKQSLETKLRISQALTGIKRGPYRKRLVIA